MPRTPKLLTLVLALLVAAAPARADVKVLSTVPASNALHVERGATIHITFDAVIDASSFAGKEFHVFGQWSGVASGNIGSSDDGRTISFTPSHPFSAGERVTVYLSRFVSAADGSTLGRGYSWQFWVSTRTAGIDLVETARVSVRRPGERWLQTYGAYAADFDADGKSDLVVPNERTNDIRLFLNDGAGGYNTFTVFPLSDGAAPSTNEAADFNRDGHVDFAVGNSQGSRVNVFMGDGKGDLKQTSVSEAGAGVRGLAVLDLNGDGYPDITTANRSAGTVSMIVNDGTGGFPITESINTPAFGETAAAAADMNEDGYLDLLVGSLESGDVEVLLSNGRSGLTTFSQTKADSGVWMIVAGDVNGDGHADVATANSSGNSVSILFGDGTGNLALSATYPSPAFPLAIDLGDIDGDGDLDMVSSNFGSERLSQEGTWRIYENLGDGTFQQAGTYPASGAGSCAVLHDRDDDGALDMTTIDELDDVLVLFSNQPTPTSARAEHPDPEFDLAIHPNPFSDRVWVAIGAGSSARPTVEIFDVTGRMIRRIEANESASDVHLVWDGRSDTGLPVPPGSYFVRVRHGIHVISRHVIRTQR